MGSVSRQSEKVRITNLLNLMSLTTVGTSSRTDPCCPTHSWVKWQMGKAPKQDGVTKSTLISEDNSFLKKRKKGSRRTCKSARTSESNRSPRKKESGPQRTCRSARPSDGYRSPRKRSPGPVTPVRSVWPWENIRSPRSKIHGPRRTCKCICPWDSNLSPRNRGLRLPRTTRSDRPSQGKRSPRNMSPRRNRISDTPRSSANNRSQRSIYPGLPRISRSARPSQGSTSPRKGSPMRNRISDTPPSADKNRFLRSRSSGPDVSRQPNRSAEESSPRKVTPAPQRTSKSAQPLGSKRSQRMETVTALGKPEAVVLRKDSLLRTLGISEASSPDGSTKSSASSSEKISLRETVSSCKSKITDSIKSMSSTVGSISDSGSSKTRGTAVTRSTSNTTKSRVSTKGNSSEIYCTSSKASGSSLTFGSSNTAKSRASAVRSTSDIDGGASKASRSSLTLSSSNTCKSMGSPVGSSSNTDGGSSKTNGSSLTYRSFNTSKSERSIVGSHSDFDGGSSKTSGYSLTSYTGNTSSLWATMSPMDSRSSIACLVHGPSTATAQDGQLKCDRCIKRPMKTRMDMQEPGTTKSESPTTGYMTRKQKLHMAKKTPSAYLQVSAVPAKLPKTIGTLEKEREARLRQKEEVAYMMHKRDTRMNDICRAYDLSRPYLYRPFLDHLVCLRQSQRDTGEYLHNVQAVVQSLERQDNLKSLAEMRSHRNKFYRTTKVAAWKALYVRDTNVPLLDIRRVSDARASFRDCLQKIEDFLGERPKATASRKCTLCNQAERLARRRSRNYSSERKKDDFFRLRAYTWQKTHKFSAPYMARSIVRINRVLKPRSNSRRNLTIIKHLRTVYMVRKLFYSHCAEFREQFKLFLMEHATQLDSSTMQKKWQKFLKTRKAHEIVGDIMALNCARVQSHGLKSGEQIADCEVCENLKQAIRQAKMNIAKIRKNITEMTHGKINKTLSQTEVVPVPEIESPRDIDECSEAKKTDLTITVIMPSTEEGEQKLTKSTTSSEAVALAKQIVANVYKMLDEQIIKGSFSDTTTTWHYIDKSELVERIVSDVLKRISEPRSEDVPMDDFKTVIYDEDKLADKVVSHVLEQITGQQNKDSSVTDVYLQGSTQRSFSDTISLQNIYVQRIVSDVLKRITQPQSEDVSMDDLKSVSFKNATFKGHRIKSDAASTDEDDLTDKIVMLVLKHISEQQGKKAGVGSLSSSSSEVACRINECQLASNIVADVLKQLGASSLGNMQPQSDSSLLLHKRFKDDSVINIFVARIVSAVLKQITGPRSEDDAASLSEPLESDMSYYEDDLADKITIHVLKQIAGQQTKETIVDSLASSLSETAFRRNRLQGDSSGDEDVLVNKIVSGVLKQLAVYPQAQCSVSDNNSQSDSCISLYKRFNGESLRTIFVERIVSDVLKRITGPGGKGIATSLKDLVMSVTSCDTDELAHKITLHVLQHITGVQSKDDFVGILAKSFSDAASPKNQTQSVTCLDVDALATRIVSDVLDRLAKQESKSAQISYSDTISESGNLDSCPSLYKHLKCESLRSIFVEKIVLHVLKRITESQSEDVQMGNLKIVTFNDTSSKEDLVHSAASYDEDELADKISMYVIQQITQPKDATSQEDLVKSSTSYDEDELADKISMYVLQQIIKHKDATSQEDLVKSSTSYDEDDLANKISMYVLQQITKHKDATFQEDLVKSSTSYDEDELADKISMYVLQQITQHKYATSQDFVKNARSYDEDELADKISMYVLKRITEKLSQDAIVDSFDSSFSEPADQGNLVQDDSFLGQSALVSKIVSSVLKQIVEQESKHKNVYLPNSTRRSVSDSTPELHHSDGSLLLDKTAAPKIYIELALDDTDPSLNKVIPPKIFLEPPSDDSVTGPSSSNISLEDEPFQTPGSNSTPDIYSGSRNPQCET